jgi:hypothetical protein
LKHNGRPSPITSTAENGNYCANMSKLKAAEGMIGRS